MRNSAIQEVAAKLRREFPTFEVFDDWHAAGHEADDMWKSYEQARGRLYKDALKGYAARHVFAFDKLHLDTSSHVVLVLPAGKSGHLELGYAAGSGKRTFVLLEPETDPRWDVMYQFADEVCESTDELVKAIGNV